MSTVYQSLRRVNSIFLLLMLFIFTFVLLSSIEFHDNSEEPLLTILRQNHLKSHQIKPALVQAIKKILKNFKQTKNKPLSFNSRPSRVQKGTLQKIMKTNKIKLYNERQ